MTLIRRTLPVGMAAVFFATKGIVVVSRLLNEHDMWAASAMAIDRCEGLYAVVWVKELVTLLVA